MEPLVFEPYLRPMVWGGRRLANLGKSLPPEGTFGESWEISAHPLHVSRVAEGPLRGTPLTDLCLNHARDLFGDRVPPSGRFPLLFKLLDCRDLLSIQVHPTDELAEELLGEEFGKTEAWVVLDVQPGGRIFAGLKPGVTREDLERHLAAGTTDQCLHAFAPKPGDCVFLPAGTVHAVGGGVVIAEVQQTSDATFRLFDWNRMGTDGKPRQLHIEESLRSINWGQGPVDPVRPSVITGLPVGVRGERLVRCPYFDLDRYHLESSFAVPATGRLSVWKLVQGTATLGTATGHERVFRRGETVLVPASCAALTWKPDGNATLLAVRVP